MVNREIEDLIIPSKVVDSINEIIIMANIDYNTQGEWVTINDLKRLYISWGKKAYFEKAFVKRIIKELSLFLESCVILGEKEGEDLFLYPNILDLFESTKQDIEDHYHEFIRIKNSNFSDSRDVHYRLLYGVGI